MRPWRRGHVRHQTPGRGSCPSWRTRRGIISEVREAIAHLRGDGPREPRLHEVTATFCRSCWSSAGWHPPNPAWVSPRCCRSGRRSRPGRRWPSCTPGRTGPGGRGRRDRRRHARRRGPCATPRDPGADHARRGSRPHPGPVRPTAGPRGQGAADVTPGAEARSSSLEASMPGMCGATTAATTAAIVMSPMVGGNPMWSAMKPTIGGPARNAV